MLWKSFSFSFHIADILTFDIWLSSGDFVEHYIDFWSEFLLGTKIAHVVVIVVVWWNEWF